MAFDEQSFGNTVQRESSSEIERLAGHEVFWLANIRNDFFLRLVCASAEASQRQRRAH